MRRWNDWGEESAEMPPPRLAETLCRRDLGWDALRWQHEWQRYRAIHGQHDALPPPE